MIWFFIALLPVMIIGGICVYFEKKTSMGVPDDSKQSISPIGHTFKSN
ncbi:hypothetical protein [Metabacillus halosaccharovorans]|uniref:Uncharacterized protein n=1 Tax=Metabacillus halosaccharovorans TaxID=930124 RepID=A0ABT3DM97_9BACI|nr:hypothetical protein [Metabacillus halosaccharovorans]MCV9888024.1 hypothetical protein [Metabacillus halosaccharovorans]